MTDLDAMLAYHWSRALAGDARSCGLCARLLDFKALLLGVGRG